MHYLTRSSCRKLGTFAFLKPGWWVAHVVGAVILLTVGYCLSEDM